MAGLRNPFRLDDEHPFTGRHMLAVVFAFFGTIITVNLVMAVLATGTFPGLVVKNSYIASQHYNERLAETRAHEQSGWKLEMAVPDGRIAVTLTDRDGQPLRRLAVTAAAGRPSTTEHDRVLDLAADGTAYRAAEALAPGLWELAIEARADGELVYAERRRIHVARAGG